MFNIEMLPAAHGDALIIEYGDESKIHRLLIDGGPWTEYGTLRSRIAGIPEGQRRFDLLVITHIDTDHIDGIVRLLQDKSLGVEFDDIWFNGWKHLQQAGKLGGQQGEYLEALLERDALPWNQAFGGNRISVSPDSELPSVSLSGGMRVTVMSPLDQQLASLQEKWRGALLTAGFSPGDRDEALKQLAQRAEYGPPKGVLGTGPDNSAANGSSIALLVEWEGKCALLAGDAFRETLTSSLRRYAGITNNTLVSLDAFKLPHHGSLGNISRDLLRSMDAKRFLVSTNGARFRHPDRESIELIIQEHTQRNPTLIFNYLNVFTASWNDENDQRQRGYDALYQQLGEKIVL